MPWTKTVPANAWLVVTMVRTDASHTQVVRIQRDGEEPTDLYEGHGPYRRSSSDPWQVSIQPWSVSAYNAYSEYQVTVVKPGVKWSFICDDGPNGDGDYNDLEFTVEFRENLGRFIVPVYGSICGRHQSRTLYLRNKHPTDTLRVFVSHYNLAAPQYPERELIYKILPSPKPNSTKPLGTDAVMGCPMPQATFDDFKWDVVDVDRGT